MCFTNCSFHRFMDTTVATDPGVGRSNNLLQVVFMVQRRINYLENRLNGLKDDLYEEHLLPSLKICRLGPELRAYNQLKCRLTKMYKLETTCVEDLEANLYDDSEDEEDTEDMRCIDYVGEKASRNSVDPNVETPFDLNSKKLERISEDAASEFYMNDKRRRYWPNAEIHDDYWEIEYQRLNDLCDMYWRVHSEFDQRMRY